MSKRRMVVVVVLATGLGLGGCASLDDADEDTGDPAAQIATGSNGTVKVTLSAIGNRRLGIRTVPVRPAPNGKGLVIPFAAVVYDVDGKAWTFTNPEGLTYVRAPITVSTITGETAILTSGPAVGTRVVTVGAAELIGAEEELGA